MTHKEITSSDKSWVQVNPDSDFPIQNLPFGIFSLQDGVKRVGVAIGEYVLDLATLYDLSYFDLNVYKREHFYADYLNTLISLGPDKNRQLRNRIGWLLNHENEELRTNTKRDWFLHHQSNVKMHLPVKVGDYTDFYSSEDHARNVGSMFRDPDNALLPNWKHLPVGYHGRSSSIIPSGQPIHRPKGQLKPDDSQAPVFGPTKLLDFELEMAFITYQGKPLGHPITTAEAMDYIYGMVIFNDWSARDIQKWEYVPLGPFLAKNFASSISLWVVTMEALKPFRTSGPKQNPEVLPYLRFEGDHHYDINLEVGITPDGSTETIVCKSNFKHMYWNMVQQLAHHTVNGCNINVGDMMASGTISGPEKGSYGSMLELSWKGTNPVKLNDGSERKFIEDGDTVTMRAHASKDGVRVGFGKVETKVLPAL
ncbi:MAG: fumarylacetoacetase [Salibacteraceae bacterium]